jgi:invasion protein IalB
VIAGTFAIAQQAGKAGHAEAAATTVAPPAAADGDESAIVDRAVIGDWIFGCVDQPRPAPRFCFIRQQLADNKTKTPIFTWTVGQDAKGNLVAVWQTPTGVLIGQGMLFDIGMERPIPVPYRECTRGQCQAVANLPRISSSDWRRQRRLEPPSWPHRGTGWHSTSASRDLPRGWQR